jgi:2-phosphosulfolactate phosphatase
MVCPERKAPIKEARSKLRGMRSLFRFNRIMKTIIRSCLDGAEKSRGVVVIIDVFRASNTILMLLDRGVSSILPVAEVEDAFRLKRKHPEYLLAGERKGLKIDGFDMGNSPHEATEQNVEGKHVIFTTSAGTQGIVHAEGAERILVGSFGNVDALTRELVDAYCQEVVLLAIGTEGLRKAVEDEMCALYLKSVLEGKPENMSHIIEAIHKGEGAQRLKNLGQEKDFPYCLNTNIFDIVPEVKKANGMFQIRGLA